MVLTESDLLRTDIALSNTLCIVVVFKVDEVLSHISVNFNGGNVFWLSSNILADNVDLAVVLGELKSVGLQVSKDLFHSELICVNHHSSVIKVTNFFSLVNLLTVFLGESIEMSGDGDVFRVGLVLLDVSNLLNASVNVETLDVFEESAGLDLGKTEEVLYVETQLVTGCAADLVTFHNLKVELVKFGEKFHADHTLNSWDVLEELLTEHADDFTLVDNNVKWVSHLVRNSRIDEADKLLLSFNGVIGQNLETLIDETENKAWFDSVDGLTMNGDLLNLELLESWETLFFYEIHVMKTFNHLLDQKIEPFEVLVLIVEAENQLFKIHLVHNHDLSQGVILAPFV